MPMVLQTVTPGVEQPATTCGDVCTPVRRLHLIPRMSHGGQIGTPKLRRWALDRRPRFRVLVPACAVSCEGSLAYFCAVCASSVTLLGFVVPHDDLVSACRV